MPSASRVQSDNSGLASPGPSTPSGVPGVEAGSEGHSRPLDGETTIFTARGPRHYPINDTCLNAARTKRAVAHWLEHR